MEKFYTVRLSAKELEVLRHQLSIDADMMQDVVINCDDSELDYWEEQQFLLDKVIKACRDAEEV